MDPLQSEVDLNYDWFQRNLNRFLGDHAGQYALLQSRSVIGFYDGPGEAYRAGLERFPRKIFSVQQVTDEPTELGFMSLAFC